ncbi:MAG: hypothetical protein CBD97_03840 [Pelagibacteraceae bacterium TMED237]|nr:hypothetical protein [Candidatus Neomarinimicrobiota bacterium]OUW95044.1 MAG: hypothetical protein CBD97_03840 [Pelagibacteraceae bacterium TMED237]
MPVGNASDGIGLFAGQVMVAANINIQHIDWGHEPVENENFDHFGHLSTKLFLPSVTIGLSDYWNVNLLQSVVVREMGWGPHKESNHHRSESSLDDFVNANGGIMGDTSLRFKYLLNNTGMQAGNRIFLGFGLSIPSDNVLTSDPFFLQEEQETGSIDWSEDGHEHRHFALSDGNYKGLMEIQIFNKKISNPVFWGVKFEAKLPIKDSSYGYAAGDIYSLAFSSLFKPNKKLSDWGLIGFSSGIFLIHNGNGYWNGLLDPSSNSTMLIPSTGIVWKAGTNSISLNIQKPMLIKGVGIGSENALNNEFDAIEITIGYRYTLDYVIPWLYF